MTGTHPFLGDTTNAPRSTFSPVQETRQALGVPTCNMDPMDQKLRQKALEFFDKFEQEWGKAIKETAQAARNGGLS